MNIVRDNLMRRKGYSPYCGLEAKCPDSWPRTVFDGEQFVCPSCGWVSEFNDEFIEKYKKKWGLDNGHFSISSNNHLRHRKWQL